MPTNDGHTPEPSTGDYSSPKGDTGHYPNPGAESAKLGYETTDVNVGGIVVFVGGLFAFVIVFFFFCFFMGKVINNGLAEADQRDYGKLGRWNQNGKMFEGARATGGKREDLKSNSAMEQQQLQSMTAAFPGPQLQTDDGNQATADLHAREDLLLDHYSKTPGEQGIRIPIDQAMKEVVAKGLPVAPAAQQGTQLAYDNNMVVKVPLTSGFARTGYELTTMESREQKVLYGKAEASAHAQLTPLH
jgi:hypothetical protein